MAALPQGVALPHDGNEIARLAHFLDVLFADARHTASLTALRAVTANPSRSRLSIPENLSISERLYAVSNDYRESSRKVSPERLFNAMRPLS